MCGCCCFLSCCVPSVVGSDPSYNNAYLFDRDEFFDGHKQTMRVFLANNALHCLGVTPETCFVVDRGIVQKKIVVKLETIAAR
jgi:hypothetical protein